MEKDVYESTVVFAGDTMTKEEYIRTTEYYKAIINETPQIRLINVDTSEEKRLIHAHSQTKDCWCIVFTYIASEMNADTLVQYFKQDKRVFHVFHQSRGSEQQHRKHYPVDVFDLIFEIDN